jgi:hypothetical protein
MLTATDALQWVTRRPSPPWRLTELRSALKGDPARTFSLAQAITGLEKQTCVIALGIRDAGLLQQSPTFAALKADWMSSVPSRNTLEAVGKFLAERNAPLKWYSSDWKTVGIVSTVGDLTNLGGIVITDSNYVDAGKLGEVAFAVAGAFEGPIGLANAVFVLTTSLAPDDSTLSYLNSQGDGIPQSAAGGETAIGSGSDILYVPDVTITGSFSGVDPNNLVDAPPIDLGEIPDTPDDSGGDDGGDNGDGDSGGGG